MLKQAKMRKFTKTVTITAEVEVTALTCEICGRTQEFHSDAKPYAREWYYEFYEFGCPICGKTFCFKCMGDQDPQNFEDGTAICSECAKTHQFKYDPDGELDLVEIATGKSAW